MNDTNYAIIQDGGRQYRVTKGQVLKLARMSADEGQSIDLDRVLMIREDDKLQVGEPLLGKAKVVAIVMSHGRDRKIKILKFKRRKHHMKRMGHRQDHTMVKITDIVVGE